MPVKWKSPLENWDENNQNPNIAFTLVARNEAAKQMWADPHNSSRYVPASFTRKGIHNRSFKQAASKQPDPKNDYDELRLKNQKNKEPALEFLFNNWPKNFAKGFVLGSSSTICDVLLGDPGDYISGEILAFTFNKQYELIMNVTSDDPTCVTFDGQKGVERNRFTWIFPRGQKPTRVEVAHVLEFDVVLPEYGINTARFSDHCESFLSSVESADLLVDGPEVEGTAITRHARGASGPQESFYLRRDKLGSGSYGDVYKALRMPDGKFCAAKRFKDTESFRQEVDMLKKVGMTDHVSTTWMRC